MERTFMKVLGLIFSVSMVLAFAREKKGNSEEKLEGLITLKWWKS
jgi:hypothetical protein